jgi:hypothetical protein
MQNQRVRNSYIPVMHREKMAVTDLSFRQRAAIEFLAKEGNSPGVTYERLSETRRQNMEWHHTTPPKTKMPKTVRLLGKVTGTAVSDSEGYIWSTF